MENCKKSLELTIPAEEVAQETERVLASLQKKVKLPGFRPGKAPTDIIRKRFSEELRQEVLEKVIPRHFWKRVEEEQLAVVGRPDISDVNIQEGGPVTYKADFEVSPEIELKDYKDLTVPYQDPEVADADIDARIEQIREQKAEYVNVDPRPVEDGDHAVMKLESVGGLEGEPIKNDEFMMHVGDAETVADFSDNLRGMTPGETKEFNVTYPEDFAQPRVAGKTVLFRAELKVIRRKELPEINDEFAQDLGDFRTLEELRDAVKKAIYSERQYVAQQAAQAKLVDALVDMHEFPVPDAYVESQIENSVRRQLEMFAAEGVDPRSIKIDWEKVKESQREKAIRDVKGSLLLGKIADAEAIHVTNEEVDREVARIAKQQREPVPAIRKKLEKDGTIGRIAGRIRTDKVLTFLFEHARKVTES